MASLFSWLNPFDVLIVLALLGSIALGFVRGLVRMALSLVVLYVAAVAAITLYTPLGKWLRTIAQMPLFLAQGLAFFFILILLSSAINFVLRRTYKDTELPGIRQIDQLGGMIVGVFLGLVWVGFSVLIIAFFLRSAVGREAPFQEAMLGYFRSSYLIPILYRITPIIMVTLRPWMPKGLPPEIFTFRL